nr:hypothetical protein [uncultured Acetatifactor sp.]
MADKRQGMALGGRAWPWGEGHGPGGKGMALGGRARQKGRCRWIR